MRDAHAYLEFNEFVLVFTTRYGPRKNNKQTNKQVDKKPLERTQYYATRALQIHYCCFFRLAVVCGHLFYKHKLFSQMKITVVVVVVVVEVVVVAVLCSCSCSCTA